MPSLFDLINDSIRRQANNFQDYWHQSLPLHVVEHLKTRTAEDIQAVNEIAGGPGPVTEPLMSITVPLNPDDGIHGTDNGEDHED